MVGRGLAAGVASLRTARGRGPGKRLQSLNASNARLSTRRAALRALNDLLEEVQADAVSLDHRTMPAPEALDRVLRLLERRCVATGQQQRFEEAVRQWADNGGMLPPGIRLRDASVGRPNRGGHRRRRWAGGRGRPNREGHLPRAFRSCVKLPAH